MNWCSETPISNRVKNVVLSKAGIMLGLDLDPRPIPKPLEKIQLAHLFIAFRILAGGTVVAIISFCL